jgi:putative membrane protein
MDRFLIRWVINAAALYIAVGTGWLPGIQSENQAFWAFLALALIFTAVNALLRPLLKLLTCPLILLTLGLFTLILNTFLFWLTGVIGNQFPGSFGFTVNNFGWAFLGALVVSLVNTVLTLLFKEELKPKKEKA